MIRHVFSQYTRCFAIDMLPIFGPEDLSKASLRDDKLVLTAPRLDQTLPIANAM